MDQSIMQNERGTKGQETKDEKDRKELVHRPNEVVVPPPSVN
jgi:hypothetical protein